MTFTKSTSVATTTSFSATTLPGSFADGASAREVVAGAQETMNVLNEEQTAKLNAARARIRVRVTLETFCAKDAAFKLWRHVRVFYHI